MTLRLLFLTESYWPRVGGTPTQVRMLAGEMVRRGHTVMVVTRRWEDGHPAWEERDGIRIVRLGPTGMGPWKKWGFGFRVWPALLRYENVDAVYCAGVRVLGVPAILAGRRKGWRSVLRPVSCGEMNGAFFDEGLRRMGLGTAAWPVRLGLTVRNRIVKRADRFVAISSAIEEELRAVGIPPERIVRIPNAVDEERFRPVGPEEKQRWRAVLGLDSGWRVVIYTGRLVRAKGLPELLRVWERLAGKWPEGHLVLVGSGGNDLGNCEAELRAFCRERGLERRVTFTSDVADVAPWLKASDLFLFPTRNEAFGISLIEAMACGLPAVSTAVGGVRDIVEDGLNALVVPAGDEAALEAAIRRLWSDPALGERLGAAARRTVIERFSKAMSASRYEALFSGQER